MQIGRQPARRFDSFTLINIMNTIKDAPGDATRRFWWDQAIKRGDWYMIIVQDDVSGYEYPIYVRRFDEPKLHYYKYDLVNDQRVLAVYDTS